MTIETVELDDTKGAAPSRRQENAIFPLWLKIAFTLMAAMYVPKLFVESGAIQILWLCNITLIGVLIALWTENRMIMSMMVVGSFLVMLGWSVDFLTGGLALGYVTFMFDDSIPLWQRVLNLDHLVLTILPIWALTRLGYHSGAAIRQWLIFVVAMVISYFTTGPQLNMNWVYGFGGVQSTLPPLLYLFVHVAIGPTLLIVPAHFILIYVMGERQPKWLAKWIPTPVSPVP